LNKLLLQSGVEFVCVMDFVEYRRTTPWRLLLAASFVERED